MRKETLVLGGIGLVTLALLIGAAFFIGGDTQEQTEAQSTDPAKVAGEKRQVIGSESAQVSVVEFADFQCPACGAAHPIVQQVLGEYEGRIEYVFRHFPLPGHRHARIAAQAAEAAGLQGKFFEMGDLLFTNQEEWSNSNNPEEIFVGYAEQLELDVPAFQEALDNEELRQAIQTDLNAGIDVGVNSTPTFYINGKAYPGVLSYDNFKQLLDEELK